MSDLKGAFILHTLNCGKAITITHPIDNKTNERDIIETTSYKHSVILTCNNNKDKIYALVHFSTLETPNIDPSIILNNFSLSFSEDNHQFTGFDHPRSREIWEVNLITGEAPFVGVPNWPLVNKIKDYFSKYNIPISGIGFYPYTNILFEFRSGNLENIFGYSLEE